MNLGKYFQDPIKAGKLGIKLNLFKDLQVNTAAQIEKIVKQGSLSSSTTKKSSISVITIPAKTKAEIVLKNCTQTTVFLVGQDSEVSIIDKTTAQDKHVVVLARKGSKSSYANHQSIRQAEITTSKYDIYLQADCTLEAAMHHHVEGKAQIDITCQHQSVNSTAEVLSFLTATNKSEIKINTINHHKKENTFGDIKVKALGQDAAHALINGMIKIDKNAKNTNSYLTQDILLLSPQSTIKAIPNLEIINNQVKASHSATIGRLSQSALYYLMSRGLTKKEATKLLIDGFFNPVIDKIKNSSSRQYLEQFM